MHSFPTSAWRIPKTITGLLAHAKQTWPDRPYLQIRVGNSLNALTYREVALQSESLAQRLIARSIHPGDRVALLAENRPGWVTAYFGILLAGGVVVPIDSLMSPTEIASVLRMANALLLITTRKFLDAVEQVQSETGAVPLDTLLIDEPLEVEVSDGKDGHWLQLPKAKPDDLAVIIFTSGTTGFSKGVMLTHLNLCSDVQGIVNAEILAPDDNFHLLLPLHHTYSATVNMLGSLALGARATFATSYKSRDILDDIRIARVTMLVCVPQVLENLMIGIRRAILDAPRHKRMAFRTVYALSGGLHKLGLNAGSVIFRGLREKASLHSIRRMISGGAALRPEVNRFFEHLGFLLLQGYGLTETSPVATVNPPWQNRIGSVGIALPGVEVKIDNPDSSGIGEICVRGDLVMRGYFENPEATAHVMEGGWFHTGDAGYLDRDGYLFITGRIKNIIVTGGGKNVYPEEIEAVLNMCPCVLESLVIGFERSRGGGEELAALLVVDQTYVDGERERGNEVDVNAELKKAVDDYNQSVPPYRKIRQWQIHPTEFEKTSTRKIRRYVYKDAVQQESKGA
ncbi:MAG TPA: AMP-dependent synthetase/ligase [bacterium]|jgi:long-chain acyl-CoA synthetase